MNKLDIYDGAMPAEFPIRLRRQTGHGLIEIDGLTLDVDEVVEIRMRFDEHRIPICAVVEFRDGSKHSLKRRAAQRLEDWWKANTRY